eukprot:2426317-Rhodomonas_salina.1
MEGGVECGCWSWHGKAKADRRRGQQGPLGASVSWRAGLQAPANSGKALSCSDRTSGSAFLGSDCRTQTHADRVCC